MKNKKMILIIMIILVVLIIGIVGASAALYFMTDIFKANDQLFAKYLFQENDLSNILKVEILEAQEQFKQNNSYTSTGELLVEIQKEGVESKQIQIATNSKYDNTTKRSFSEAILKNGETDLFNISYINSSNVYAVKSESVYPYYIGIRNENLKQFAKTMGLSDSDIAQIPDVISLEAIQTAGSMAEFINEQDSQYFIDTYSKIVINSIAKDKYSKTEKTEITIDGKNYQANGYLLTLNQEDIKQIWINVLTKAKDDPTTLSILENILYSLELEEEQISQINFQAEIQKLLDSLQENFTEEIQLEIIVYQANGKNIRTQIKINDEANIMFDIANNTQNNKKVIITMEILNSSDSEENASQEMTSAQITVEKIISDSEVTHETSILMDNGENSYEIIANTTLGNVVSDTIYNVSNVSIQDYNNNIIDVSYNKTIQKATEPVEIQELTNSNTAIVNNYPKEQLEPFIESIVNKYGEVLGTAVGQLNLSMTDESDLMNYIQGIAGSVLVMGNANGLEPIGNVAGTVAITVFDFIIETQMQVYESANNAINNANIQQQAIQAYNSKFIQYEGIQSGSAVRSLCDAVRFHNVTATSMTEQVKLQLSSAKQITTAPTQEVTSEEINNIKNQIQAGKNYNIDFGYDSEGRIVAVGIAEAE